MCGPFPTFRADDARCDWQCNNLACAHNDCTSSQAIDKCIPEHDAAGFDHSVPPRIIGSSSKLVPLTLTMTLPVLKPVLNAEVNQQVLSLDIGHSLTWTSPDLWRSPCVLHTPGVISMSRSEGNSDMARCVTSSIYPSNSAQLGAQSCCPPPPPHTICGTLLVYASQCPARPLSWHGPERATR